MIPPPSLQTFSKKHPYWRWHMYQRCDDVIVLLHDWHNYRWQGYKLTLTENLEKSSEWETTNLLKLNCAEIVRLGEVQLCDLASKLASILVVTIFVCVKKPLWSGALPGSLIRDEVQGDPGNGGKHCQCTESHFFCTFTRGGTVTRVKTIDLGEEEPLPKYWIAGCSMKIFAAPRYLCKHTVGG